MTKIFIDPGHGGDDPGATANGLKEKDLTLDLSKRTKKYLDDNYTGHTTKLSRTSDKTMSLKQRTDDANKWGADYFLSIHINAGGGTGYEDYIYNGLSNSSKAAKIRNIVHAEIVKTLKKYKVKNRGKKKANFHVLRESKMPAMLSETLFIDTGKDAKLLKDNKFLKDIGQSHAKGIAKALKLKSKSSSSSKPSKPKPKPSKPSNKDNLTVDGKWGKDTTRALQRSLGTPVDGVLGGQLRNAVTNALYGNTVSFGSGGSVVIRALQRKVGATADGLLGPDTVRRLQRHLGTVVDGKLSRPSLVVKELQRRLNAGTF